MYILGMMVGWVWALCGDDLLVVGGVWWVFVYLLWVGCVVLVGCCLVDFLLDFFCGLVLVSGVQLGVLFIWFGG